MEDQPFRLGDHGRYPPIRIDMSKTIERLQTRVRQFPPVECETNLTTLPPSPVSLEDYNRFEHESGLVLPQFVRLLYTEVADGGYGPAYGINPLAGGNSHSIAGWDRVFQNANHDEPNGPQWPSHLIRFCEIGCNMFYALDIRDENGPVFQVEPASSDDVTDWLKPSSSSVTNWLDCWLEKPVPDSKN